MKLHYLQHVPFEGPTNIATWAQKRGWPITGTPLFDDAPLPKLSELDWLVVMGGPMSTADEKQYPWLIREKRFIEQAIAAGKVVVGVCLGAQLIAEVLGARVYPGPHKEIGWFDVQKTPDATESLFSSLPDSFTAFHWHGDTFDLPSGCVHLAESQACKHQAFSYDHRVLGLQFHIESTPQSVAALVEHCSDELIDGPYVQSAKQMVDATEAHDQINQTLNTVLDTLAADHSVS